MEEYFVFLMMIHYWYSLSCLVQNHKPPILLSLPNDPPPPLPPPPIRNHEENRENRDPKQPTTEPSEEVVLSAEFQNEIGGIVNQLSEFKTELLKLHGVVSQLLHMM